MNYLQKSHRTPTQPFAAINAGSNFYPCTYQSDTKGKKPKYEVFVYGKGWLTAKTFTTVPLFDGTTQDEFESYLKTWGKYCLFYSLTGYELGSGDCSSSQAQNQFYSLLAVGFDYMQSFFNQLAPLNKAIYEATKAFLGVDELTTWMHLEKGLVWSEKLFYVKPHFTLYRGQFLCAPHVDCMSDDSHLWTHFVEVYHPVEDADYNVFPVSVKDRLAFLFGEQVATDYEKLLTDFPLSYNPATAKKNLEVCA